MTGPGEKFDETGENRVDREPVLALGHCDNCGPHSLTTVEVTEAEYIASCVSCDNEMRGTVVERDGEHVVEFGDSQ